MDFPGNNTDKRPSHRERSTEVSAGRVRLDCSGGGGCKKFWLNGFKKPGGIVVPPGWVLLFVYRNGYFFDKVTGSWDPLAALASGMTGRSSGPAGASSMMTGSNPPKSRDMSCFKATGIRTLPSPLT